MSWKEEAKKQVALEAIKYVKDGFIIGLGSGSTASYAIKKLGELRKQKDLKIFGIPSSSQAMLLAVKFGLPLTTLDENPTLDLVIDGADEVNKELDMIKGGGGALTREKIIASSAKKVIIIADETKLVEKLGLFKVPVEVLPFGLAEVTKSIKKLGGRSFLREGKKKVGPVVTDNGNYIIDVDFGLIDNSKELDLQLRLIPGIVETGLFIELADIVYLGTPDGIIKLEK